MIKLNNLPDFTDKKVIDAHMDAAGLSGVSRREFLAFSTASVAALAGASSMGLPGVAMADTKGKNGASHDDTAS